MDDQQSKRGMAASKLLWLLVLVAVVVLWWYFRPDASHKVAQETDVDALGAIIPDEIVVDLKDDVTPDQIAALERELDIQLSLVDQSGEADATKLYVVSVSPDRRDELIAKLSARTEGQVAEPDALLALSPGARALQ